MSDTSDQKFTDNAARFKALHNAPGIFVCPNPWDAGSARILQVMGFKALATTSAGLAFSLGLPDGNALVTRGDTLENLRNIINATDLPVSGDLENGFGLSPDTCAETVTMAAQAGLSGGSIEDASGNENDPIIDFELAVERIKYAVAAARSLPREFMLTARAENLIHGKQDLGDTIKRLVAFADAGADVLFAPGLKTPKEIEMVVRAVAPKPVNVLMGISGTACSVRMLEDLGVKRISVGSSMIRAAIGAFMKAAEEIATTGTFTYAENGTPYAEINAMFMKF